MDSHDSQSPLVKVTAKKVNNLNFPGNLDLLGTENMGFQSQIDAFCRLLNDSGCLSV